jgi:hypothetical protein
LVPKANRAPDNTSENGIPLLVSRPRAICDSKSRHAKMIRDHSKSNINLDALLDRVAERALWARYGL